MYKLYIYSVYEVDYRGAAVPKNDNANLNFIRG